MSSRIDNHWDRILAAPPPSLEELTANFPGYTFYATGWGEDQEFVLTSLPPHMEARIPKIGTPSHPPLDLSTFTTPQRCLPVLNTVFITSLNTSHSTPSSFVLKSLNSFSPFPPVDAGRQNELLPYVPEVTCAKHVAAASNFYAADVAANRSHGPATNDEIHCAIGNSSVNEGSDRKEKKARVSEEREGEWRARHQHQEEGAHGQGSYFDRSRRRALHGQIWQQIVSTLSAQNFCHKTISAASVQHKAEALVLYKKTPTGNHKNLSNVISEGTSASITIRALLECLETQFDAAKDKSDNAKAKLKKKNNEDREGGESICQASMHTHHKRARSPASNDDANTTNCETSTLSTRTIAADSSLETINSDDDNATNGKKASKRCRGMRRSTLSDPDGLLALIKAENAR
ncbi:hypothetical protein B0H14DRAFT_3504174 [Mycena olivaceomarginata]|nr:hypothetical protein B0H14DRAFT_3504174 [Mycena olivaceomarginata]